MDAETINGEAGPIIMLNTCDKDANPTGGYVSGVGFRIDWQDGPRGQPDGTLAPATGAFVEDITLAVIERIRFFQKSKFVCRENAIALTKLEEALHWMQHRRADRARRNVLGRHKV
jgi:hypothetical protein